MGDIHIGDKAQRIFPMGLNLAERILGVAKKFSKAVVAGFQKVEMHVATPLSFRASEYPIFQILLTILSKKELKNLVSCKKDIGRFINYLVFQEPFLSLAIETTNIPWENIHWKLEVREGWKEFVINTFYH
jgi:hypothetical protein